MERSPLRPVRLRILEVDLRKIDGPLPPMNLLLSSFGVFWPIGVVDFTGGCLSALLFTEVCFPLLLLGIEEASVAGGDDFCFLSAMGKRLVFFSCAKLLACPFVLTTAFF